MNFYDQSGKPVLLGKKIGTGGEGAVFEVPSLGNDIVAKVYHQAVPLRKTAKAKEHDEGLRWIVKENSSLAGLNLARGLGSGCAGF